MLFPLFPVRPGSDWSVQEPLPTVILCLQPLTKSRWHHNNSEPEYKHSEAHIAQKHSNNNSEPEYKHSEAHIAQKHSNNNSEPEYKHSEAHIAQKHSNNNSEPEYKRSEAHIAQKHSNNNSHSSYSCYGYPRPYEWISHLYQMSYLGSHYVKVQLKNLACAVTWMSAKNWQCIQYLGENL